MGQNSGFQWAEVESDSLIGPPLRTGLYGTREEATKSPMTDSDMVGIEEVAAEGGISGKSYDDDEKSVVDDPVDNDDENFPEAVRPATPREPGQPTKREWDEHMLLHWPYRSWCKHCVKGRAVARAHGGKTDEDREWRK